MLIDRRRFILAAGASAALIGLPAWAAFGSGFTHNVASGEPGPDSVLLWTRYVSQSGARLTAELSESLDFTRLAGGGSVDADPDRDHIAKITIAGLAPGRWYYYRFVAPDGSISPTGRTRTLPVGHLDRFNLAVFSCSNLPFGWFNAYAHAAGRQDIDLVLHLGDYIYEYRRGVYPSAAEALPGRIIEPATEIVHLADYRLRYASYRADRDLQALHQFFPMVFMWDDHETANDSWTGGAENHDPATEGEWSARKAASIRAAREWMPVSDSDWTEYQIGDLATIFRPETRLTGRSHQLDFKAAIAGSTDVTAALRAFRDDIWSNPARTMLGSEQEAWLADAMRRSVRSSTRWQILAQQTNIGFEMMPAEVANWVPADAPDYVKAAVAIGATAAGLGIPHNMDNWNGYPAARSRLLRSALDTDANLVVLSGDSHNAWAYDLAEGKVPAAVEFGGHSVTSPGYESYFPGIDPRDIARAVTQSSPELRWADTARRGYMTVAIERERTQCEWLMLDTIRDRSQAMGSTHREAVMRGARRMA